MMVHRPRPEKARERPHLLEEWTTLDDDLRGRAWAGSQLEQLQ
jgi:hypothetical protein